VRDYRGGVAANYPGVPTISGADVPKLVNAVKGSQGPAGRGGIPGYPRSSNGSGSPCTTTSRDTARVSDT
jgi:hypothetical protein